MRIIKYFINALGSLWRNKLRSALSTLGIVIGIASVSIMLALWEWLKEQMLQNLTVSNDIISIVPKQDYWPPPWEDGKEKPQEAKPFVRVDEIFTDKTIEKIKKYIWNIKSVIALWTIYPGNMKFEWKDLYPNVSWVSLDYIKTKDIKIVNWYSFTPKHFLESSKVVILWNGIVTNDLQGKNPVWKKIMIGWYAFDIIGVLVKNKDWQVDSAILVPMSTAEKSFWLKTFSNIQVYLKDITILQQTKKDLLYLLLKLSNVSNPADTKFIVESNDEAIKEINKTITQMQLFLWWIASISLLVWWIGIMNIMLVSITERTREIGIRKAIGAKKRDILIQFLTEAVVISILGCIIAFGLSLLGVYLINKYAPVKAKFNINVIIFSSLVSIAMWVIFGILPAWKASRMKPIDALRFE